MAKVVAIDNNHDLDTQYAQAFRESLVYSDPTIQGTGRSHRLIRLSGGPSSRNLIETLIALPGIEIVTAMGHGRPKSFLGEDDEYLITTHSVKSQIVQNKIFHFLACQTGIGLGKRIVERGAKAFWGYKSHFDFGRSPNWTGPLDEDPIAEPFFRLDCIVISGILNGKNPEEILRERSEYYREAKGNSAIAGLVWYSAIFDGMFTSLVHFGN